MCGHRSQLLSSSLAPVSPQAMIALFSVQMSTEHKASFSTEYNISLIGWIRCFVTSAWQARGFTGIELYKCL